MSTMTLVNFNLLPPITVGTEECRRLTSLAGSGSTDMSGPAESLLAELERATVVADAKVPPDVVRMNSTVLFRYLGGEERSVELVFPGEADISDGKISVLTPVGAALIGLRTGDSITWEARDGRKQMLTVLWVRPPSGTTDADDPGPEAA